MRCGVLLSCRTFPWLLAMPLSDLWGGRCQRRSTRAECCASCGWTLLSDTTQDVQSSCGSCCETWKGQAWAGIWKRWCWHGHWIEKGLPTSIFGICISPMGSIWSNRSQLWRVWSHWRSETCSVLIFQISCSCCEKHVSMEENRRWSWSWCCRCILPRDAANKSSHQHEYQRRHQYQTWFWHPWRYRGQKCHEQHSGTCCCDRGHKAKMVSYTSAYRCIRPSKHIGPLSSVHVLGSWLCWICRLEAAPLGNSFRHFEDSSQPHIYFCRRCFASQHCSLQVFDTVLTTPRANPIHSVADPVQHPPSLLDTQDCCTGIWRVLEHFGTHGTPVGVTYIPATISSLHGKDYSREFPIYPCAKPSSRSFQLEPKKDWLFADVFGHRSPGVRRFQRQQERQAIHTIESAGQAVPKGQRGQQHRFLHPLLHWGWLLPQWAIRGIERHAFKLLAIVCSPSCSFALSLEACCCSQQLRAGRLLLAQSASKNFRGHANTQVCLVQFIRRVPLARLRLFRCDCDSWVIQWSVMVIAMTTKK